MNSRDEQIINKIYSEIAIIHDLTDGLSEADFIADERTVRAVCMTLINIGELVKSISDELKQAYREVPWRAISGMRDVTAHKYQTLRKEDVYSTCTEDIPQFERQLKSLLDG